MQGSVDPAGGGHPPQHAVGSVVRELCTAPVLSNPSLSLTAVWWEAEEKARDMDAHIS